MKLEAAAWHESSWSRCSTLNYNWSLLLVPWARSMFNRSLFFFFRRLLLTLLDTAPSRYTGGHEGGFIYLGWTSTATPSRSATMTSLTRTLSDISAYSPIKQLYQGPSHCFMALFTFQSNIKAALHAFSLISRYQCKSAWRGSGATQPNLQTRTWLTSTWSPLSGAAKTRGIMRNKAPFTANLTGCQQMRDP